MLDLSLLYDQGSHCISCRCMVQGVLHCTQGTLVGKVLTKADVEHCRVALPRLAMEANMPEVVDAITLHVVSTPCIYICILYFIILSKYKFLLTTYTRC